MIISYRGQVVVYLLIFFAMSLMGSVALAHDPVFGLGPHVLFKGGVEIAPEIEVDKSGDTESSKLAMELTYGLTGDWAAGVKVPYVDKSNVTGSESGQGDLTVFSKYRFWRKDRPGLQESMSVAVKVKADSGDASVGTGSTDGVLGLTYGYEGRKWYRWAALRYRMNGEGNSTLQRGDKILFDLVGGVRLKQTGYLEPDTVWLIELNGESTEKAELNGIVQNNSGGIEWFVSPGIFWTKRNFAVKAGVQIPVLSRLNGVQQETDYRTRLILEWHL